MAFPNRRKTKKNKQKDEISTRLITKPTNTNNINPYYDTFGDDNNDKNSNTKSKTMIDKQMKTRLTKLKIRKMHSSNKSTSALSPIVSASEDNNASPLHLLQQSVASEPVTPNDTNRLTPKSQSRSTQKQEPVSPPPHGSIIYNRFNRKTSKNTTKHKTSDPDSPKPPLAESKSTPFPSNDEEEQRLKDPFNVKQTLNKITNKTIDCGYYEQEEMDESLQHSLFNNNPSSQMSGDDTDDDRKNVINNIEPTITDDEEEERDIIPKQRQNTTDNLINTPLHPLLQRSHSTQTSTESLSIHSKKHTKTKKTSKTNQKKTDSPQIRPKTASSIKKPQFFDESNNGIGIKHKNITPQLWDAPTTPDDYGDNKQSPVYGSTASSNKYNRYRPNTVGNKRRSNSNSNLSAQGVLIKSASYQDPIKKELTSKSRSDHISYRKDNECNDTLTSYKSGGTFAGMSFKKTAKLMFGRSANYDADDEHPPQVKRLKTAREHNKRFIMDRIQTKTSSLYRRRSMASKDVEYKGNEAIDHEYVPPDIGQSTLGSGCLSFSINEEAGYEMVKQMPMDYNLLKKDSMISSHTQRTAKLRKDTSNGTGTVKTAGMYSRKQLVYIGGINYINRYDVRDRLYDLFEMWGDKPDISESDGLWDNDCIYVRFPSIAKAIDGIQVFDGIQPNGYILNAELVLEGSQMVYIDGLDGEWNEEIFKNFVDRSMNYKVSIKRANEKQGSGGDKAYAFVQFTSLEAVQSAIDRFDGETEIDGKLVRWEHMVKAYIGKIGDDTKVNDIQRELSEFDPSFKHLPVEIRKSREPVYYRMNNDRPYETDFTSDDTERRKLKQEFEAIKQQKVPSVPSRPGSGHKKKKKKKRIQKPMERIQIVHKSNPNDSLKSGNNEEKQIITPRVGTGSIVTEISSDNVSTDDQKFTYKTNDINGLAAASPQLTYSHVIRVPSLSTIQSMSHLETRMGSMGSMDSNDWNMGSIHKSKKSGSNILSPAIQKQLSLIVTTPIMEENKTQNIGYDASFVNSGSDDTDGELVVVDEDAEEVKQDRKQQSTRNIPKFDVSKSADCIDDMNVDEVQKKPSLPKQKTYSTESPLSTVLSSGSGEDDPYLSVNSMASMPLYSESVNTKTPKQLLDEPSTSISPIQQSAELLLHPMEENKEQIVEESPFQRQKGKSSQMKYDRKLLNKADQKKKKRVTIKVPPRHLEDSLEFSNDADDEYYTPDLHGSTAMIHLNMLTLNASSTDYDPETDQQRKQSVEEQKSDIPILDETKSMSNNDLLSPTGSTPKSRKSNKSPTDSNKPCTSPISQPSMALSELSRNNLNRTSYSRSVSRQSTSPSDETHRKTNSNVSLQSFNKQISTQTTDSNTTPTPKTNNNASQDMAPILKSVPIEIQPSQQSSTNTLHKFSVVSDDTTVTSITEMTSRNDETLNASITESEMTEITNNIDMKELDSTSMQSESETVEQEYEWHHYAYIWFWNKYDAMRAQTRFDKRHCFGSTSSPVRFLLMNDMTQKVYVSGLMEGYTNKETIEQDIGRYISGTPLWRKKCIVTYRANGMRPFAYLRFPSVQATREAIDLFDNQICFGNQRFPNKREKQRIHLEMVRDESDLLSHHVSRKWNAAKYWYLTFSFLFLPITLSYQWMILEWNKFMKRRKGMDYDYDLLNNKHLYCSPKELASTDLLSALFSFNDRLRICLMNNRLIRLLLLMVSYALYIIFYFLVRTIIHNLDDLDVIFSALLPLIYYFVISQLWSCWVSMNFDVVYPQFHVLEHVSMYFEDSVLYSRIHVMASDFASSKEWDLIKYPWEYPIEWKKRIIIPSLIYPFMLQLPSLIDSSRSGQIDFPNHTPFEGTTNNGWDILIELLAALLMFWFCYILFCAFNTITLRTLSYWKEVHNITELITLKSNKFYLTDTTNSRSEFNFLRLDNENNLFSWLSLRTFIHRKGDVVFCGLEMQALFLVIMVFLNIIFVVIVLFGAIEEAATNDFFELFFGSGFILSQIWFLLICLYYICYILLIGYWFGVENEYQLNRVERQKLFLYTERMKQLLNHEKYKLIDNTKITDLKLLLNSMEALVQHVETKEITPQLWGIKMNDFKWKVVMTVIAAVIPSIAVRWMLNVN